MKTPDYNSEHAAIHALAEAILKSAGEAYTNPEGGYGSQDRAQRYDRVVIGETLLKVSYALAVLEDHDTNRFHSWEDVVSSFRDIFKYGKRWFPHVNDE
jgi:hypothetical protein